jgi:hypothetical protein
MIVPRTPGARPDKMSSDPGVSRSVATDTPANDNDQIPVLVSQAPGEEIALALLAAAAPLGYALGNPSAQAAAQASIIFIVVAISQAADTLAKATPHILPVLPVVKKVDDEIPQILARFHPVPEEIAQIAVPVAIAIAPSLS